MLLTILEITRRENDSLTGHFSGRLLDRLRGRDTVIVSKGHLPVRRLAEFRDIASPYKSQESYISNGKESVYV